MRHIVEKTGSLFPEFPLFVLLKQNFVDWRHAGKERGTRSVTIFAAGSVWFYGKCCAYRSMNLFITFFWS